MNQDVCVTGKENTNAHYNGDPTKETLTEKTLFGLESELKRVIVNIFLPLFKASVFIH